MKFKNAFTLAEILIVMVIIGIIAVILIQTLNPNRYSEKTNIANARKAIELIKQATSQMIELEKEQIPTGTFMTRPAGSDSWEITILNEDGNDASVEDIVNLFGNYIKYESDVIDFCNFTSFCNNENVKGAKVAGGIYIGFEKFDDTDIDDCPAYYMPNSENQISAPTTLDKTTGEFDKVKQCWGKVYIDVNGIKGPDTEGQDVFVYGLGEYGMEL